MVRVVDVDNDRLGRVAKLLGHVHEAARSVGDIRALDQFPDGRAGRQAQLRIGVGTRDRNRAREDDIEVLSEDVCQFPRPDGWTGHLRPDRVGGEDDDPSTLPGCERVRHRREATGPGVMTRVLVLTPDVLRARMAGPAMRAWHIAQRLAEEHEVRLLTTSPYCEVSSAAFLVAAVGPKGLAEAEAWCDVMILQGYVMYHHPVLAMSQKIIVFDIYSPLHLETLALTKGTSSEARDAHVRLSIETLNHQLERGDFLICASERQRDLFIGQLCAVGRTNALTYDPDPTLRRLIDVVPFGLPDDDAEHRQPALRGVVPGIGPDDDILIWAGGVYDWFDPLTLIRAVAGVSKKRPSVRLYFMGMQHPNPDVPPMQMAIDARALAEELGVAGKHVFFNDGWVEYSERQNFLLEATLGVSTHFESLETRFSFRTRALDYLWAGLPIVATEGDSFGQLIEEEHLGLTVPPEDPQALAGGDPPAAVGPGNGRGLPCPGCRSAQVLSLVRGPGAPRSLLPGSQPGAGPPRVSRDQRGERGNKRGNRASGCCAGGGRRGFGCCAGGGPRRPARPYRVGSPPLPGRRPAAGGQPRSEQAASLHQQALIFGPITTGHSVRRARFAGVRAAMRPGTAATRLASARAPSAIRRTGSMGTLGSGTASISWAKRSHSERPSAMPSGTPKTVPAPTATVDCQAMVAAT